jgi:hypothetical protein
MDPRATESHTLGPSPRGPRYDALLNPASLKFRQGGKDMELELSRGRRAVDPLAHRNERHAQRLEFIE